METLVIKSNIKKIAIKNEYDEVVAELKINIADASVFDKFQDLIETAQNVDSTVNQKMEELKAKYADNEDASVDMIVECARVNIDAVNEIIEGIDGLFGAGTIRQVFADNYSINDNFVPEAEMIIDFLNGIMPIMSGFFKKRLEANKDKYSTSRAGAYGNNRAGRRSRNKNQRNKQHTNHNYKADSRE